MQNLAEIKISKIKKEAEQLEIKMNQERTWYDQYKKKSNIAKINLNDGSDYRCNRIIQRERC